MAKKDRITLKRYFHDGALPSADQFGNLIDSTLNMIDEGFDRSPQDGFEITLIGKHSRLISFFRSGNPEQPVWTIEYDQENDRLEVRNPRAAEGKPAAIVFDGDGNVGIAKADPGQTLDVGGIVAAEGRIGANPKDKIVPADGDWHDITEPLHGCHAYEVMAGVGSPGTGRYALMRAVAINTFNPRGWWFNFLNLKKRIRYQQAYFLSRGNRIKLRWHADEDKKYTLQMRTACGYGEGVSIRFYLTKLWVDPDMSGSQTAEGPQH